MCVCLHFPCIHSIVLSIHELIEIACMPSCKWTNYTIHCPHERCIGLSLSLTLAPFLFFICLFVCLFVGFAWNISILVLCYFNISCNAACRWLNHVIYLNSSMQVLYTPHTLFRSLRALNWVVVSLLHAYLQFTKTDIQFIFNEFELDSVGKLFQL